MATPKQQEAQQVYFKLMTEVRVRLEAIDAGLSGKLPLPSPLTREFCYLQMRMICELVALGCLVAHGDIEETKSKKLQGEYNAHRIMERLAVLHKDYFPKPMRGGPNTQRVAHFEAGPIIVQEDLLKLYHECGEVLHRGNSKKLLSEKSPTQIHFPDITKKAQQLADLLALHVVTMLGNKTVFLCNLRTSDTGLVQVSIAEASAPPADVVAESDALAAAGAADDTRVNEEASNSGEQSLGKG